VRVGGVAALADVIRGAITRAICAGGDWAG